MLPQPTDDFIYRIELLPPPKAAALAFLDAGGPAPRRYARAIVFKGAATPRHIQEYKASRVAGGSLSTGVRGRP